MRPVLTLTVLGSCFLVGGPASARPSTREVAAEEMFKAGRALLAQQKFTEACEKLDASESLAPAVGTLLSLGECYEGLGRDASAWFTYREATALAARMNDPRRTIAERHASALEPLLATVLVRFTGERTVASADVALDGETFRYDPRSAPIPADPGAHTIKVSVSGFWPWDTSVLLTQKGERLVVDVPRLAPLPRPAATPAGRVWGAAAAGTGAVVFGVGAILGAQAIVKARDVHDLCPGGGITCSNAGAVHENTTAKGFADAATIAMPVGAALLATGAFLYFTSFRRWAPDVSAGAGLAGARLNLVWTW